jgi:hypothetical protein
MNMSKLTVALIALFVVASGQVLAQPATEPRPLAPGVLKSMPPQLDARDSFTPAMMVPGLTATKFEGNFTPNAATLQGQSNDVFLFRNVWHHDFATLGLRQIQLGFRNPEGQVVVKHFWYLVYRVRDLGKSLSYEEVVEETGFEQTKKQLQRDTLAGGEVNGTRITPQFSLEGWVLKGEDQYERVAYADQYLPLVAREIQKLEDPNQRLYNKFEIRDIDIPRATADSADGVWGVAVWEDVNPDLDFVSVYARGLTNAYQIHQAANGDLSLKSKTLQINFWRPGDRTRQILDKVRYGIPLVDNPVEQTQICRHYQLPGPQVRAYLYQPVGNRESLVAALDAEVNLDDFSSPITAELDEGTFPESLRAAIAQSGYDLGGSITVKPLVKGLQWEFETELNGETRRFVLRFEPQFWEKKDEGIRFIKSLDYLWIYR